MLSILSSLMAITPKLCVCERSDSIVERIALVSLYAGTNVMPFVVISSSSKTIKYLYLY